MARLCSMMSGTSAGRFQGWGGELREGSLTCLVLDGAEPRGWGCPLEHLHGFVYQGVLGMGLGSQGTWLKGEPRWGCILFMTNPQKSHGISSAMLLGMWQSQASTTPRQMCWSQC